MQKLLNNLPDGTQEIQIGSTEAISTPIFAPEIKGREDLYAILTHLGVLEEKNPIVVPGHRWRGLRDSITSEDMESKLEQLLKSHPIFMMEPPELFRFSLGGALVTYALKGSIPSRTDFNSELTNSNIEDALSILPSFFQPFAQCQLSKLYSSAIANRKGGPDYPSQVHVPAEIQQAELNLSVADVWRYRINDVMKTDYFITLIKDALSFEDADIRIIPPVPPLRRTDDDVVEDVLDTNEKMLQLCMRFSSESKQSVYPYLHLYVDQGIFADDSVVRHEIFEELRGGIQSEYSGLALTVTNYEEIWENEWDEKFESFVTELNNICEEHYIPIICPRSEYFGAYISDLNINMFSSLLKKMQMYSESGPISAVNRYSSIPDIENGTFLNILEVDERLVANGELSHYPGIKSVPDKYPPYDKSPISESMADENDYETLRERFLTAKSVRKEFIKPRWLAFVELASRLRDGRREGQLSPAKNHFRGADHPYLS
jgi:hypothetical protein